MNGRPKSPHELAAEMMLAKINSTEVEEKQEKGISSLADLLKGKDIDLTKRPK
ncbi:MAG TPA: hypothetical protein VG267_22850 [Terracidiphilus sp.]|jgi:hypothetical protein|nr:hypothetical protein [Terracidiphilus sp.]